MKSTQYNKKIIDDIEAVCKSRSIKLTKQRKTVLEIMLNAAKAMSAYDLLDLLKLEEPQAKPPTIYRVLEFLLEHGFIHKVESSNSYILCPHFSHPNHVSILFICNHCKQILEKNDQSIETDLLQVATQNHFTIKHSIIEIHGICDACHRLTPSDNC